MHGEEGAGPPAFHFKYESRSDYLNQQKERLRAGINADFHVLEYPESPERNEHVVLQLQPKDLSRTASPGGGAPGPGGRQTPPGFAHALQYEDAQKHVNDVHLEEKSVDEERERTVKSLKNVPTEFSYN